MNDSSNRIEELNREIAELNSLKDEAKTMEGMMGIKEPLSPVMEGTEILDLQVTKEGKILELTPKKTVSGLKKAGYVDALVLSFMVASFSIATVICMVVRVNMG